MLGRLESRLHTGEQQHAALEVAMSRHDMVESPDEAYYRDRYLTWINAELEGLGIGADGALLDAGCGSGRLLVPLAQRLSSGRAVGIDFLADSVSAAERHASAAGVTNVSLIEGDLLVSLREQPEASFDAVVFLEVAFVLPELDAVLTEIRRVLKPGGVLFASFRSRYWWQLAATQRRDWDLLVTVQDKNEGVLPGVGFQTWHSGDDVSSLLSRLGFDDVRLRGVGSLSGIEGDPLSVMVQPSELDSAGERALAHAEDALSLTHPDIGRYVLASAVKRG
jgi:SAM-dependent methyltransferase